MAILGIWKNIKLHNSRKCDHQVWEVGHYSEECPEDQACAGEVDAGCRRKVQFDGKITFNIF